MSNLMKLCKTFRTPIGDKLYLTNWRALYKGFCGGPFICLHDDSVDDNQNQFRNQFPSNQSVQHSSATS